MSACVNCGREFAPGSDRVAWAPANAGESVWSIVQAHVDCMKVGQLKAARSLVTHSPLIALIDRRLGVLLSGASSGSQAVDIDTLDVLLAAGDAESVAVAVDLAIEKDLVHKLGARIVQLSEDDRAYRECLEREQSYDHYSDAARGVLVIATKWFDMRSELPRRMPKSLKPGPRRPR